jgi:hypothetical protein
LRSALLIGLPESLSSESSSSLSADLVDGSTWPCCIGTGLLAFIVASSPFCSTGGLSLKPSNIPKSLRPTEGNDIRDRLLDSSAIGSLDWDFVSGFFEVAVGAFAGFVPEIGSASLEMVFLPNLGIQFRLTFTASVLDSVLDESDFVLDFVSDFESAMGCGEAVRLPGQNERLFFGASADDSSPLVPFGSIFPEPFVSPVNLVVCF